LSGKEMCTRRKKIVTRKIDRKKMEEED